MILTGRGECESVSKTKDGGIVTANVVESFGGNIVQQRVELDVKSNYGSYGDFLGITEGALIHWVSDLRLIGEGDGARLGGTLQSVGLEGNPNAPHYIRAHVEGRVNKEPEMRGGGSGVGAFVIARLTMWNRGKIYADTRWRGTGADRILRQISAGSVIGVSGHPSVRRYGRRDGSRGAEISIGGISFSIISSAAAARVASPADALSAVGAGIAAPWDD